MADLLLVQMTIYSDNSYLGHKFQDVGYNLWLRISVNIHTAEVTDSYTFISKH